MDRIYGYPGHDMLLPEIVRAEGCHVVDAAGRRYLDLESGVWCTALGHGEPRVVRALTEQAARLAHAGFNYASPVVEETARELLALTDMDGGRCVFLCSGSEAVEYAVRVGQIVAERPRLLAFADGYFGAYGAAARRDRDAWHVLDWFGCADCPDDRTCDATCERLASVSFAEIGGLLLEPGSSSGLVRFPPARLIQTLARTIQEADGLVIVNEVTTGIGRTGRWFGYQHYDIAPDIVVVGKGLGNGYPVSAALFAPAVVERLAARLGDRPIPYAQSHQNDPLGAAVARAVLGVIRDDDLVARGAAVGEQLLRGLAAIREHTGGIAEVRGRGLMVAIELVDGQDLAGTVRAQRELLRRGFLVGRRPGVPVLRLDPPLTLAVTDVEAFLVSFADVLATQGSATAR